MKAKRKPVLQVLQGEKNFKIPTYAESDAIKERFDVIKAPRLKGKADVVFCQAYGSVWREIMKCKKPLVLHMGGSPWLELKGAKLQRVMDMCVRADRVVCNSKFLLGVFEEHLGKQEKLVTLPDGLWGMDHTPLGPMTSRFEPKTDYSIEGHFKVVMSFTLKDDGYKHRKWSGIPVFLKAVEKVAREYNVKFLCAGRGDPHFEHLEEWERMGLVFSPSHHIDDGVDRWPRILRGSDLFVHPSLFDCWPRSVGDAMCAGLPGMVFDATGNAEVSGIYPAVDPADTARISELFEMYVTDESVRELSGTQARREAEERSEKGRKNYLNIFLEVLG